MVDHGQARVRSGQIGTSRIVACQVITRRVEIAGKPFTIRASGSLSAFAEHWPRSDRPGEAACHIFQCADWIEVWLDTVGHARRIRPVFVGVYAADGQPVLLFGLCIERRNGARVLGFLDGAVSDYNQPVLFPAASTLDAGTWKRLWAAIARTLPAFDLALFEKVTASCRGVPNPLLHFGGAPLDEAGHVMDLPPKADALEARLPQRKLRTRMLKQLAAAEGPVGLAVAHEPAEAAALLREVVALKARQYERTGMPGFDHPGTQAFYEAATQRLARPGTVHVSALKAGEAILACHWGLILGDRFYLLLTAYAPEWKRYSPGALLHDALIRWAQGNGLASFDFGIGNEAYKTAYSDARIPLYRFEIPHGPAGRAHLAASRAIAALRGTRFWKRLRPIKWALIRRLRGR